MVLTTSLIANVTATSEVENKSLNGYGSGKISAKNTNGYFNLVKKGGFFKNHILFFKMNAKFTIRQGGSINVCGDTYTATNSDLTFTVPIFFGSASQIISNNPEAPETTTLTVNGFGINIH